MARVIQIDIAGILFVLGILEGLFFAAIAAIAMGVVEPNGNIVLSATMLGLLIGAIPAFSGLIAMTEAEDNQYMLKDRWKE